MPMNYWGVTRPTLPNNDASEENISEMEGLEELKMIPRYQWHSLCMLLQGQKVFLTVPYRQWRLVNGACWAMPPQGKCRNDISTQ